MKAPVLFPVFKHRQSTLLDRIEDVGDRQVFCFYYTFDKDNYDFSLYPTVIFIEVPDTYLSGQKMKRFIQDWAIDKGFQKFWLLDDDIDTFQYFRKYNGLKQLPLHKALDYAEHKFDTNYYSPRSKNCYCLKSCFLIDKDAPIKFSGDDTVLEDLELTLKLQKENIPFVIDENWLLQYTETDASAGWYEPFKLLENTLKQYN